jgi:hypothetical protein
MKIAVGVALLVWLLCGLAGAWMVEDEDRPHLERVVRGPITLIEAFQASEPVKYPDQV